MRCFLSSIMNKFDVSICCSYLDRSLIASLTSLFILAAEYVCGQVCIFNFLLFLVANSIFVKPHKKPLRKAAALNAAFLDNISLMER